MLPACLCIHPVCTKLKNQHTHVHVHVQGRYALLLQRDHKQ